jgi:septin family protein
MTDFLRTMHRVFRSLKKLDIECMKALHYKVNIVPIIAKADTLTPAELTKLKSKVSYTYFTHLNVQKKK